MATRPAYVYPFRGIFYLLTHPQIWSQIFCGLMITIFCSIVFSVLLFVFAFPHQSYALSEYMSEWLAWLISFVLTLYEIATSVLIFSSLFLSYYMNVIFDAVWREETMNINANPNERVSSRTYSCIKSFFVLILFRVFLLMVTSPLNLIPILGTIFYIYINGYFYAWSLHCRYFDLLSLTFSQGKHYVEENRQSYTRFGVVAVLLEMIPLLNLVTPITNVIGSALWACDIEKNQEASAHPRSYLISPSPALIEQGQTDYGATKNEKDLLPPPPYQEVVNDNQLYPSAPPMEKQ